MNVEMNMDLFLAGPPLIALLSGIAILIWPKLLNYCGILSYPVWPGVASAFDPALMR